MNQAKQKIGYISVNFTPETVRELLKWSKEQIPEDELFIQRRKGGNVADKAHLTLFFGLDDSKIAHDKMSDFLSEIHIDKLEVQAVDSFSTKQPGCKILILKIADFDNQLLVLHDKFFRFPHLKEHLQTFVPHVTIAYVKESFDVKKISFGTLPILLIQSIDYRTVSK